MRRGVTGPGRGRGSRRHRRRRLDQDRIEIRTIDAGNPTRFARGWHCIGLAKNLRDGKSHQVEVFGTNPVVFADVKGELHLLDAYCRHMRGNLARDEIKGDAIA